MIAVRITVTGGTYEGTGYEGLLAAAPVTVLVPEGIASARTEREAERVRAAIGRALDVHPAVTMGSTTWALRAERADE